MGDRSEKQKWTIQKLKNNYSILKFKYHIFHKYVFSIAEIYPYSVFPILFLNPTCFRLFYFPFFYSTHPDMIWNL